uniref:Uncharacterized protein n=1 Tax=Anopheles dirus TaxID=7168 RepID=A0A182NVW4_9DIPT
MSEGSEPSDSSLRLVSVSSSSFAPSVSPSFAASPSGSCVSCASWTTDSCSASCSSVSSDKTCGTPIANTTRHKHSVTRVNFFISDARHRQLSHLPTSKHLVLAVA